MRKNIERSYDNVNFADEYPNIARILDKSEEKYKKAESRYYIKNKSVEDCFYLNNGKNQEIRSLRDLSEILKKMSNDEYGRHVIEGEKNDFAEWAEKTHKQKELAHQLRKKAKTPKEAADIIDSDDWVDLEGLN